MPTKHTQSVTRNFSSLIHECRTRCCKPEGTVQEEITKKRENSNLSMIKVKTRCEINQQLEAFRTA